MNLDTLEFTLTSEDCLPDYTNIIDQDGFVMVDVSNVAILHNWGDVEGVRHWSSSEVTHKKLWDTEYGQLVRLVSKAPDMLRLLKTKQNFWHCSDETWKEIQEIIDFIEKDPRWDY